MSNYEYLLSDINKINDSIKKIGSDLNLSEDNMNSCLESSDAQDNILNQRIEAHKKYKIKSTPTIVVNEKEYTGKVDYEKFKKIIEKDSKIDKGLADKLNKEFKSLLQERLNEVKQKPLPYKPQKKDEEWNFLPEVPSSFKNNSYNINCSFNNL